MQEIQRIGVWSLSKLYAVIGAIVGLIAGIFIAVIGMIISSAVSSTAGTSAVVPFAGFGIFSIILLPIIYGVLGLISGAVGAVVYNLVAKMIGGMEVEIVQK